METSQTRSRRKRGIVSNSQEEGISIAWLHDQRLRSAVLEATENGKSFTPSPQSALNLIISTDHLDLPSPTQRPRPVSSLLSPAHPNPPLVHSLSNPSRYPRKRPCRSHRSLPLTGSHPYSPLTPSGSSSMPIMSALEKPDSQRRLDVLLGEAMAKFALDTTETSGGAQASVMRHAKCNPSNPASSDKSVLRPSKQLSCNTARAQRTTRLKSTSPRGPEKSSTTTAMLSQHTKTSTPRRTDANPSHGLRWHLPSQSSIQKAIASPLISARSIRQSPRRTVAVHTPQPLRGPSTTVRAASKTNTDPSSDGPDVDQSIDSFDGMLLEGGPEIEELFKKVDGSR